MRGLRIGLLLVLAFLWLPSQGWGARLLTTGFEENNITAGGTMALKVWDEGGSGTEGPTMTVNSTTWRILTGVEHQAYDISAKTKASLDSFSAGYIAKSGAVEKRISALWANVEWIEAPGGGRSLMLFGVGP